MDTRHPDSEPFTMISTRSQKQVYDDWQTLLSAKTSSLQTSVQRYLRTQYPELCITPCISDNVALLPFAYSGNAIAELDTKTESVERFRYFYNGNERRGVPDALIEGRTFAKYVYVWDNEYYLIYVIPMGFYTLQYILKEPDESTGESPISLPAKTDTLIRAVGKWMKPDNKYVYVYDYYWMANRKLWEEVQKAKWEDVILKESMKRQLVELMKKFFESRDIYRDLGVPWKRGVIFHGPVGNGKTISIKALMHSLSEYKNPTVPALYVKSAPRTWDIRDVFQQARAMAPCMLILEDIDTIVTSATRSYFFNEVDGLENNDGIFMIASTNHLDQLDPGLSSRPSRFDRKYLFPLPDEGERVLYCKYWRRKLAKKQGAIKFPFKLCPAIAGITDDFSFAYLKEAFVATLLAIAGRRSEDEAEGDKFEDLSIKQALGGGRFDDGDDDDDDKPLEEYELWREMKKTVASLREDMGRKDIPCSPSMLVQGEGPTAPNFLSGAMNGHMHPSVARTGRPEEMHFLGEANAYKGGNETNHGNNEVGRAMMFDEAGTLFECDSGSKSIVYR